ncbi:MAG: hypothetical protein V9E89_19165 [Ilumatobacteraceae bacterium]
MTSDPRPPQTAPTADRDQKAEIVDRLYDVALDPIKLEHLLEVWEGRAAPLRQERTIPLEDPEIEAHMQRATVFLDRYDLMSDTAYRSVLEDIPRSAAFLSDGGRADRRLQPARGGGFRHAGRADPSPRCPSRPRTAPFWRASSARWRGGGPRRW